MTRHLARTSLSLAGIALAATLGATGAAASDPPAPKAEARADAKAEPRPAAAAGDLDALRERLAAKLGATKPAEAHSPNLVRVSTKAGDGAAEAGGHGGGRVVSAAPRKPSAAVLAAVEAHRAAQAAAGSGSAGHAPHWSYAGEGGPAAWGGLKPEFQLCSVGQRQSPIDVRGGIAVDLEPVQFDYRASGFNVVDNGHTVQVNIGGGNSIQVGGRRYELVQFHFHRPSEERINGRQYDMSLHLVHKDPEGRLAVVGLLLERGAPQPVVQSVWNNLPLEKGMEQMASASLDLNGLLPADRGYYTYMGSLTTPPCSEGVLWMVMRQPVPVSQAQIDIFARLYPMNARPVQQASGRLIKQSQ
ncbi:MAG: carbonic anhydrase family protein [Rubrivivax sp.]